MSKKVLILGGTGTMGKPLVDLCAQAGYEINVVCRHAPVMPTPYVNYILGDAYEDSVIRAILNTTYDAIVDFLWHGEDDFKECCDQFLSVTKQYFLLSSCAVYADSDEKMTESYPRFLDVDSPDTITADSYHYQKAFLENILREKASKNWTIVRPHITYGEHHLPLSIFGENVWLYRVLRGQSIIFPRAMLNKKTNFTSGKDVARMIFELIGNEQALGKTYNVVSDGIYTWGEILEKGESLFAERGIAMNVCIIDDINLLREHFPYMCERLDRDRLLNRTFSNEAFKALVNKDFRFGDTFDTVAECLDKAIANYHENALWMPPVEYAVSDIYTKSTTKLSDFKSRQSELRYLAVRYPYVKGIFNLLLSIYLWVKKLK